MRSKKRVRRKLNKKRVFQTLLSLGILLAIFLGGIAGYYGSKIGSFLDGISADEEGANDPQSIEITQQLEDLEPFSALILGVDDEDGGASRSDTIIVATVNPKTKDIKLVSVPRDARVTLPNGTPEKINAAFATGGPQLAREMVSDYLDIPIDFYATMDFEGLVELVDAVGGITVESDLEFTQSNHIGGKKSVEIQEGTQTLDGAEALGYARMRKEDPQGDFGRQQRQQEVIIEVLDRLASFNTITNLTGVLDSIEPYLQTNATSRQMLAIAGNYSSVASNVEQLSLDGTAYSEYFPLYGLELYVWEPYAESLAEVQGELQEHLELDNKNKFKDSKTKIESVHPSSSETMNNE